MPASAMLCKTKLYGTVLLYSLSDGNDSYGAYLILKRGIGVLESKIYQYKNMHVVWIMSTLTKDVLSLI